jgi:hypothetical protein
MNILFQRGFVMGFWPKAEFEIETGMKLEEAAYRLRALADIERKTFFLEWGRIIFLGEISLTGFNIMCNPFPFLFIRRPAIKISGKFKEIDRRLLVSVEMAYSLVSRVFLSIDLCILLLLGVRSFLFCIYKNMPLFHILLFMLMSICLIKFFHHVEMGMRRTKFLLCGILQAN